MSSEQEYDYLCKVVVVGGTKTGKSSLIRRFTDDSFSDSYISTIGVDFAIRSLTIDGSVLKAQIWDTAGQERFQTITTSYYRGSNGAMVVFDITDRESFEKCQEYIDNIKYYSSENIPIFLVGNKNDMEVLRDVTSQEAGNFAAENRIEYIETSAEKRINVEKAFVDLFKECVKRNKASFPVGKMDAPNRNEVQKAQTSENGTSATVTTDTDQNLSEWRMEIANALKEIMNKLDVVDRLETTVANLSERLEKVEEKLSCFDARKVDFKTALSKSKKQ